MIMGLAACGASDPIGGAAGGVPGGTACQNDFTPERVAAGENCDPNLNRTLFCPLVPGSDFVRSRSEVIPCDGVEISTHPAAGGGLESDYIAIRPSSGGTPSAVYLNLHYLGANVAFYGNLTRMTELAKARNVVVLLPQAPLASAWPTRQATPCPRWVAAACRGGQLSRRSPWRSSCSFSMAWLKMPETVSLRAAHRCM